MIEGDLALNSKLAGLSLAEQQFALIQKAFFYCTARTFMTYYGGGE